MPWPVVPERCVDSPNATSLGDDHPSDKHPDSDCEKDQAGEGAVDPHRIAAWSIQQHSEQNRENPATYQPRYQESYCLHLLTSILTKPTVPQDPSFQAL